MFIIIIFPKKSESMLGLLWPVMEFDKSLRVNVELPSNDYILNWRLLLS